ncbi:MAG TPA: PQQ-binding-like beta-propeller repeat protein, partial [Acidimicrobiales bacterium]|nr:PQQ-binding-like beta-propeller repeat protein [Acidimicrobiales bacterium]
MLLAATAVPAGAATGDWPQFRADPPHTGFNASETVISTANVASLAQRWTATTGGDVTFSSPAVANGVVYVGSNDHKLYAFDAAGTTNCSGTPIACSPLWTATTGGQLPSSPAVAHGVVYVGSLDGKLYAFDAASGALLWAATTGSAVASSPTEANGVVYVGSDDGKLYAFDAASGAPVWAAT